MYLILLEEEFHGHTKKTAVPTTSHETLEHMLGAHHRE